MGKTCSTYREDCIPVFGEDIRDRDHWKDLDVGGRIILKWIFPP
jgi:hypothetical protein